MAEQNAQSIFTPSGGMNQDDSIVTPMPGSESGTSLFQAGDYRYALNSRIGSSREDNFGDLEIIRDTVEVTDFVAYTSLVTNPDFTGSLEPWAQLGVGIPWTYSVNKAILSTVLVGPASSQLIYQNITFFNKKINVSFSYNIITGFNLGFDLNISFLNGTTTISTQKINSVGYNPSETKSLQLDIPDGCNRIGFRVTGNSFGTGQIEFDYLRVNGFTATTRPAGDEKTIGRYEDSEFQRLYYAVYNSAGNHAIRYFDPLLNVVFEILRWSGLNFQSNYFVKFAKLDNWMAFTDRNNNPRLIDTDGISELYTNLGSVNFREFHISFHKWAPVMPPVTRTYWDGVTNNIEKLKEKTYQWAYRYVYKGNLRSRFSPSSVANNKPQFSNGTASGDPAITAIELYIPGIIYDDPSASTEYNYFNHNDVKFLSAVQAIEIVYRESQIDLWRMYKTIEINGSFSPIIRYTGEANSTPISDDDFFQLFDTVPFLAGTVEAIDNRFMFGDCLDEHDPAQAPIVTDIGTVRWDGISNPARFSSPFPNFPSLSGPDSIELARRNSITLHSFKARGKYKLGIIFSDKRGWVSGTYTNDSWMYNIPETTIVEEGQFALTFKLSSQFSPPEWAVSYQIVRTDCLNINYFMFGYVNAFTVLIDDLAATLSDINTLPQDAKNRIAQHFENSRIVDGYEFSQKVAEEEERLLGAPPIGGKFIYQKRLKTSQKERDLNNYLQSNNISPKLASQIRSTKNVPNIADGSRVYIDVKNWYNASKADASGNKDNPMNSLFYNFREGDRVRFLGSLNSAPNQNQKQVFDELILEFTGNAIICKKPEGLLWMAKPDGQGTIPSDFVIEVYTPNVPTEGDYIYYETGEWYPVLFPATDQRTWSKSDWVYTTTNAVITGDTYGDITVFNKYPFDHGDCTFLFKKTYRTFTPNGSNFRQVASSCMTNLVDKTYGEWDRGDGRPSVSYRNYPVVKFKNTQIRFGGKIIEESFVNNINRFREEDQNIYSSEYGRIRDLVNTSNAQVESVGSIVLAIGERETWSIYVNRTTLEDLSGRTQVSISDKVLGSFNTLLGSYGTLNPESVSKKRGKVWYWDAINGSWIRYGRDGLTPISDYKMRNWFKELGNLLRTKYMTDEVPRAISDYDPFNEELVTRIDHSSLPEEFRGYDDYKGTVFSENDRRWKGCHSYTPELFAKLGNLFIGFKNGGVFIHEQGEGYSTFYGVKYDVKIEPVFNPSPIMLKSWQTLAVVSTETWMAERILSEYRGQKTIQQSNIPLTEFQDKEDTYWAAVLNDENTVNVTTPLIEGNKMRSKAIQVLLTLDPEVVTRSLLHYVSAGYIDSPKNP